MGQTKVFLREDVADFRKRMCFKACGLDPATCSLLVKWDRNPRLSAA